MQNDPSQLEFLLYFQVGDLALPEGTLAEEHNLDAVTHTAPDQRHLADDDRVALSQLAPDQVQEWCLSRIAHYHYHNGVLREGYGGFARNAISKNKSRIRALHTAYNDAAPIHRHFPPEVLIEVFSHVHPVVTVVRRLRIPLLGVCRCWRRLLFMTSRFWANILTLPIWETLIWRRHIRLFRRALTRSAPASLALSIPYYSQGIVDILLPHASRLSSLDAGPTVLLDPEQMAHPSPKIKQRLLCVSHRPFVHLDTWHTSLLTFSFTLFPNLRSLQLQHSHFHPPAAPYVSLSHLKLDHCAVRPLSSTSHAPALSAIHNALELFPNLETMSLTCCLSEKDEDTVDGMLPAPDLTKVVHLPRLRHLELADALDHLSRFLSHIVFPPTASLSLCPSYISRETIPLFPGLEPSPTPHAELHVEFVNTNGGTLVHWETRGDNVRPVRVTVSGGSASCADIITNLTRALVAALAPARGLTTFTVEKWHTQIERYWDDLWPVLGAQLRRLQILEYTRLSEFVQQQQLPRPVQGEGTGTPTCACPVLEVLALKWLLPPRLDYGLDGDWCVLRDRDDGRHLGHRAVGLLPSLREFCDMLRACLSTRAVGGCSPLRRLEVMVCPRWVDRDVAGDHVVLQGWQMALVGERMRDKLGDLVADIAVTGGGW